MPIGDSTPNAPQILIVGIPRSGTTWQFNTLRRASEVVPVFEPDNEALNPFAIYYKRGLHRFPVSPTISEEESQQKFWSIVFQGGWKYNLFYRIIKAYYLRDIHRIEAELEATSGQIIPPNELIEYIRDLQFVKPIPSMWLLQKTDQYLHQDVQGKQIIVKSVHCARELKWINQTFNPEIVIILRRIPNLIASYFRLRLNDSVRGIQASPPYSPEVDQLLQQATTTTEQLFHKMIIQACELSRNLVDFQELVPRSRIIQHEEACLDPKTHFTNLFQQLSLQWNREVDLQISEANKPGTGFAPTRDATKEQDRHSDILTKKQLDLISTYCRIYQLTDLM